MSERKLPKDGLELLSARFLSRMATEWREHFDTYQRDALVYLMSVSVARNKPSVKLSHKDMENGIPPHRDPVHYEGLPRFMPLSEESAEEREKDAVFVRRIFGSLRDMGVITIEKEGGPNATRWSFLVDLTWTPERINA